ncbi:TonB-dependent receptor [Curvibacter sp. HBC28]|uniref:TonB-dependent receptor n=1 Tax=Curvibacter microcysteis TaxID=3026419 RepID=A0ABT5MI15_9BURK|nr:TonB-dependent receptor [Curvibacter sp. HBC28]MDD0814771.1 TonB-dependent receptor [Curvibacter sp. HBC28]
MAVTLLCMWMAAEAQAQTPTADGSLPTVTVTAMPDGAEDLTQPYSGGQVATGARLGMMGQVDQMDAPFNITAFTSQVIEDQQSRTLADVLSNDPSVRFTTSSGHAYENFRIRGFDVNQNDVAVDGMFGLLPIGHVPVEFIERVEVLKGPNAALGGMAPSGAVGGVVNLALKRAGEEPLSRVTLGYQTTSQLSSHVDIGRRLGADKALGIRINGVFSEGETALSGQSKQRELLAIALDYRGRGWKATLDLYDSKESFRGGTSAMYWFTSTSIPAAPDSGTNPFPTAYGDLRSQGAVARAEYQIHEHLSAYAGFGVMSHDFSGFINGTHVRSLNAAGISSSTRTYGSRGYNDNVSAEGGLRGQFKLGSVRHEWALQTSNLVQAAGAATNTSAAYTTSLYSPSVMAMPSLPGSAPKTSESVLSSVGLLDTLSFMKDAVRLSLGLRHQRVKTTNLSTAGAVTGAYDESAVTPMVGLVLKPWGPGVSLYANRVQGLSKGDSVSTPTYAYNYTFAPYKTDQREVGIKWDTGSFTHTFSLFEIHKPMLITLSGNVPSDGGEKRVRGLEWYTFGELARGTRLLGGVVYTDGQQTKTANNSFNGKTAVGAPRWQGNLGLEWDVPTTPGLTLSGKVVSSSSQYLDAGNTQQLGGWAELEAGARYTTQMAGKKVVWRLNVVNLMNRRYYSGAFSDTTPIATLGQGRTLMTSLSSDF